MLLAESLLGTASTAATFIEDVFSTYLYTGNGSTQTITNGIDLSGKGGLVWIKDRSFASNHRLFDTSNGVNQSLLSNLTLGLQATSNSLTAFNSNGFSLGNAAAANAASTNYASWTFRKQAKFFDVVTYTGTGVARTIAHNLGSVPGCIIVKRTSAADNWYVYHRSTGNTNNLRLNSTNPVQSDATYWNSTNPTSTVFSVGGAGADTNANGATYVAYLFAHDAGGFGAAGTDNVISCGSYTGNGGTQTVTLGYEPQWVLVKNSDGGASGVANWVIVDNMRGMPVGSNDSVLYPNLSDAEASTQRIAPTATGFTIGSASGNLNDNGAAYIYIAIRRGPMKTPTTGTSVFGLNARTGTGANATVTGGQTDDAVLIKNRGSSVASLFSSRLTGTGYLVTSSAAAQTAAGTTILQANPWDVMDGVKVGTTSTITNASSNTFINYLFRRAPGFFDVVCYTGTGSATTVSHNLGVAPEFIIVKQRAIYATNWRCYHSANGATNGIALNLDLESFASTTYWNDTAPTSLVFTVGTSGQVNESSSTYVAYLFATVAGVSKVFSYTGNGSSQTINCGFTGGARFVLIKRTDSTGDWYVWDSARGIVAANDPHLSLNSTAAEVTTDDSVDTDSSGFIVNQVAATNINVNAATYIGLAIA